MNPHRPIPHILNHPDWIIPPIPATNYPYFANGSARPEFDAATNALNWSNAWWLAEASLTAYHEQPEATGLYGVGGLQSTLFGEHSSFQAYVLHDAEKIIIAFRGTEMKATNLQPLYDWFTNLDVGLAKYEGVPGRVHAGFGRGAVQLVAMMADYVAALRAVNGRPLFLTGHSQGGALAAISAFLFPNVKTVYTFGAPTSGDQDFVHGYTKPLWRFCYHADPVARVLPSATGYRHAGTSIYFPRESKFEVDVEPEALLFADPIHHAPAAYAALAWNMAD
jgi:hypothetical protein